MFDYPFRLPFRHPFSTPFHRAGFGEPIPPNTDELLVWLKGDGTDGKADSWADPDAENMVASQSNCVTLNGVDESGVLTAAVTLYDDFEFSFSLRKVADSGLSEGILSDAGLNSSYLTARSTKQLNLKINGTLVTFWGSKIESGLSLVEVSRSGDDVTITINGVSETKTVSSGPFEIYDIGKQSSYYLSDRIFGIKLKDATKDISFPLAEESGTESFSTTYDTDGLKITWTTSDAVALRAGRQDDYHFNINNGWYEITGDPVKYPYPVTGYDVHHEGGTWNDAESKLAFVEDSVVTLNGTDDEVQFSDTVPSGATLSYEGEAVATLDIANSKVVCTDAVGGRIRAIKIMDGSTVWALLQCDEGELFDLADSSGNSHDATITTTDIGAIWANTMLPQSIIDMENAQGTLFFMDSDYHGVPMTQADMLYLSDNLISNWKFRHWTSDNPDDWYISGEDSGNTVTEDSLGCRFVGDGSTALAIRQLPLVSGKDYVITINMTDISVSYLKVVVAGTTTFLNKLGDTTINITATDSDLFIYRGDGGVAFDCTIGSVVCREKSPVMNSNDQYFMSVCAGKDIEMLAYKNKQVDPNLAKIKTRMCL